MKKIASLDIILICSVFVYLKEKKSKGLGPPTRGYMLFYNGVYYAA